VRKGSDGGKARLDIYKHRLGRTVTETDNTLFTALTLNSNPIHFDQNLAEKTYYGKILVNSCYTLSLAVGLSVADLSEHVMANLGWDGIRLLVAAQRRPDHGQDHRAQSARPDGGRLRADFLGLSTRRRSQGSLAVLSGHDSLFGCGVQSRGNSAPFVV
jgi:hypothetical protein